MPSECPKPGIYRGMPFDEYWRADAINMSRLKLCDHSLAAFIKRWPIDDTPAMREGRLFHRFTLEPERFTIPVSDPPINPATNKPFGVNTNKRNEWEASFDGGDFIGTDEHARWCEMRDAIRANRDASAALSDGESEVSVFWNDPVTNLLCKCRIDWLAGRGVGELKTCESAGEIKFGLMVDKRRYLAAAAFQLDGLQAATGYEHGPYSFVAVEKTIPYKVECYYADALQIATGRSLYRKWLDGVADARKTGVWPSSTGTIRKLWQPPRVYHRAAEEGIEVSFDEAADSVGPLGF